MSIFCSHSYLKLFGKVILSRLATRIGTLHQKRVAQYDFHVILRLKPKFAQLLQATSSRRTRHDAVT